MLFSNYNIYINQYVWLVFSPPLILGSYNNCSQRSLRTWWTKLIDTTKNNTRMDQILSQSIWWFCTVALGWWHSMLCRLWYSSNNSWWPSWWQCKCSKNSLFKRTIDIVSEKLRTLRSMYTLRSFTKRHSLCIHWFFLCSTFLFPFIYFLFYSKM